MLAGMYNSKAASENAAVRCSPPAVRFSMVPPQREHLAIVPGRSGSYSWTCPQVLQAIMAALWLMLQADHRLLYRNA